MSAASGGPSRDLPRGASFAGLASWLNPAMVIVTTAAGQQRAGCLVGFHAQSSIDPLRYAVWISRPNHTYRVATVAEVLAVHFLTEDQHDLATWFGTATGDEVDKFDGWDWEPGPGGVPLLRACPDRLVGQRAAVIDDGGDHVCVTLDPLRIDEGGHRRPPLRYGAVRDLEAGHDVHEPARPRAGPGPGPGRDPGAGSGCDSR